MNVVPTLGLFVWLFPAFQSLPLNNPVSTQTSPPSRMGELSSSVMIFSACHVMMSTLLLLTSPGGGRWRAAAASNGSSCFSAGKYSVLLQAADASRHVSSSLRQQLA
jgi:hypothetical protein